MSEKKYNFLKKFSYVFGFCILIYNLYLFDFNLPTWTEHYGLIHYNHEWTKQDFINSLIWEHMGVPFFRLYTLSITSVFGNGNIAFIIINFFFFFLFINIIIKIFTQSNNKIINILFLYLVVSVPFYGLTILWPFHSGLFLIFITYFSYLIFLNQKIDIKFIFKFNFCCLLLSFTWPAFNYLIFILVSIIFYLSKVKKENRFTFKLIFVFFLTLQIIIPLKNKFVFGFFGPSSLVGFAKMNSFWNWVSEEKRENLYKNGTISYYFYNALLKDFNGNYPNFLKKNNQTKKIINDYSNKKNLYWYVDQNWNYVYKRTEKKINYLNERFNYDFIAMHEPAMVAIFDHFGDEADKTFKLIPKDEEIFKAFKQSLLTRIGGQLLSPDLYYKFYPIYMKSWEQQKEFDKKYQFIPTFNIFKITNIKKKYERVPSSISVFAIVFSAFLSMKLLLGFSISHKKKYVFLLLLYLLSILLAFKVSEVKFFELNFYNFITVVTFISILILFKNEKIFNYKKERDKIIYLIPTTIIIYFFLVIFVATLFEGTRYFGLITPIFFAALYNYINSIKQT